MEVAANAPSADSRPRLARNGRPTPCAPTRARPAPPAAANLKTVRRDAPSLLAGTSQVADSDVKDSGDIFGTSDITLPLFAAGITAPAPCAATRGDSRPRCVTITISHRWQTASTRIGSPLAQPSCRSI